MQCCAMDPDPLKIVLWKLHEAGGSRVPADEIAWTLDLVPAINTALTMQYVIYRETPGGRLYSLTSEGYKAIGLQPREMTIFRAFKLAFGLGR